MRVEIDTVKAVRNIRAVSFDGAVRVIGQLVMKSHSHRMPGISVDRRSHEGYVRIDAGALIAAELNPVKTALAE
jgi:hypothetical protein